MHSDLSIHFAAARVADVATSAAAHRASPRPPAASGRRARQAGRIRTWRINHGSAA